MKKIPLIIIKLEIRISLINKGAIRATEIWVMSVANAAPNPNNEGIKK
jgi:hypothetical protein